MKKAIAIGAMALTALLSSTGTAQAEDVLEVDANGIPWSWYSKAACEADAPLLVGDPAFDVAYPWYFCDQGVSGLWYFYSTDQPN